MYLGDIFVHQFGATQCPLIHMQHTLKFSCLKRFAFLCNSEFPEYCLRDSTCKVSPTRVILAESQCLNVQFELAEPASLFMNQQVLEGSNLEITTIEIV